MAKSRFVKYSNCIKTSFKYKFNKIYSGIQKRILSFRRQYDFNAYFTDLARFVIDAGVNGFFILFGLHYLFGIDFTAGKMFGSGFLYLLLLRTFEKLKQ